MKKIIIILLAVILSANVFAQVVTTKIVKVANATTTFNENLLSGIEILNIADTHIYLTLKSIPATKSISTCILDVDLKELTSTVVKAKNGLIIVTGLKDTIKLGGTLTDPTIINQNGKTFKILDSGHGSVFSQTGIAYTKIDTASFGDSTLITKLYAKKYKLKNDSILGTGYATNYRINKYFVPYQNAHSDVDLNTHSILAEGQQLPLSNGGCQISSLTDNGNGSVTLGTGDYHLSANVSGKGSHNYTLTGGIFALTDQSQNYIVADYNSGSPYIHVITDVTLINETTIVPVYSIYRNGSILHIQNWDALGIALANKIHQSIVKTQRYRRESGLAVSEYGTHNLNLATGRVWTGAVPITLDAIATATDNLFFFRHVAGVWTPSTQTTYNFTQYDNGTNLVDLTTNRYAVNWIFRGVESNKHLYIVAGTGDYTENQAVSATLPAIPIAISSHAVLVAKLIVQKNAATALSIQSAFDVQFGLSAIQSHGDLTGRDAIDSHPAGAITNTPYGTVSSTTVQLAINELSDEKEPIISAGTTNQFYSWDKTWRQPSSSNLSDNSSLLKTTGDQTITSGIKTFSILPESTVTPTTTSQLVNKAYADTKAPLFSGTTGFIPKFTGTNTIGNSTVYVDGSNNIGIGTIPNAFFEIAGGTSGRVQISDGGGNSRKVLIIEQPGYGGNTYSRIQTYDYGSDTFPLLSLQTAGGDVQIGSLASTNPELLSHSSNGTITKVSNGTGFVKNNGSGTISYVNDSQQALSGTNVTWNLASGKDATITLTGNTVITLSNATQGLSGTLWVTNPSTVYTITFAGYVNDIDPFIELSPNVVITYASYRGDYTFKYNGSQMKWNGCPNRKHL